MKIAYDTRSVVAQAQYTVPPPVPEAAEAGFPAPFEEPAATLELSRPEAGAKDAKTPGPKDASSRLTRRLVAAAFQGEVRSIISEAYENLSEWIKAAMSGDEKAMAAIRRLNKLIHRANRKIGDLDREDVLRLKQRQAEKRQQDFRAGQIERELHRRIQERKLRERRYLNDRQNDEEKQGPAVPESSPAALQAKIHALAAALAQLTAAPLPAPADSGAVDGGYAAEAAPAVIAPVETAELPAE
ncbi:MAG: hypothetical protein FWG72_02640 [Oscillospiraceae bacterium]|nr:hypothetical protein [Oscillospiraceae bacterium]